MCRGLCAPCAGAAFGVNDGDLFHSRDYGLGNGRDRVKLSRVVFGDVNESDGAFGGFDDGGEWSDHCRESRSRTRIV